MLKIIQTGTASTVFMMVGAITAPAEARFVSPYAPSRVLIPVSVVSQALVVLSLTLSLQNIHIVVAVSILGLCQCISPPTPAIIRELWTHSLVIKRQKAERCISWIQCLKSWHSL
jgi:hypothetical protein